MRRWVVPRQRWMLAFLTPLVPQEFSWNLSGLRASALKARMLAGPAALTTPRQASRLAFAATKSGV